MGLSGPVPARVPAAVKDLVLATVDEAVAAGFSHTWACSLWQVSDSRVSTCGRGDQAVAGADTGGRATGDRYGTRYR